MQIFYYNLFTVPLSRMDALRNILFLVFRVTDSTSIGFLSSRDVFCLVHRLFGLARWTELECVV